MPAIDRLFGLPRSAAITLALSLTLGGCVAAPLLELAAAPVSNRIAACNTTTADGTAAPCDPARSSSMIPGMAGLMQVLQPGMPFSR